MLRHKKLTEEVEVRISRHARVPDAAILDDACDLLDSVLHRQLRVECEGATRLVTRHAVVAQILKRHFGELRLDVRIERCNPLREPADRDVLALEVEDPPLLVEERGHYGFRNVAYMEKGTVLVSAEDADSPMLNRLDCKEIQHEIQPDSRVRIADAVNRAEPEDDRVRAREHSLRLRLRLGVE